MILMTLSYKILASLSSLKSYKSRMREKNEKCLCNK